MCYNYLATDHLINTDMPKIFSLTAEIKIIKKFKLSAFIKKNPKKPHKY